MAFMQSVRCGQSRKDAITSPTAACELREREDMTKRNAQGYAGGLSDLPTSPGHHSMSQPSHSHSLYSFWPFTPIISENVQGRAWYSYVVMPSAPISDDWIKRLPPEVFEVPEMWLR